MEFFSVGKSGILASRKEFVEKLLILLQLAAWSYVPRSAVRPACSPKEFIFLSFWTPPCCRTVSSEIEQFGLAGKPYKQQGKQMRIASGSPWNRLDLLGPSIPLYAIKAEKLTDLQRTLKQADLQRLWEEKNLTGRIEDQTSCLEEAETSWAFWKRFIPESLGKYTLQLLSICRLCRPSFVTNAGVYLSMQLFPLSHFCSHK